MGVAETKDKKVEDFAVWQQRAKGVEESYYEEMALRMEEEAREEKKPKRKRNRKKKGKGGKEAEEERNVWIGEEEQTSEIQIARHEVKADI